MDLALNTLQRLICHKTQTNKQIFHGQNGTLSIFELCIAGLGSVFFLLYLTKAKEPCLSYILPLLG